MPPNIGSIGFSLLAAQLEQLKAGPGGAPERQLREQEVRQALKALTQCPLHDSQPSGYGSFGKATLGLRDAVAKLKSLQAKGESVSDEDKSTVRVALDKANQLCFSDRVLPSVLRGQASGGSAIDHAGEETVPNQCMYFCLIPAKLANADILAFSFLAITADAGGAIDAGAQERSTAPGAL